MVKSIRTDTHVSSKLKFVLPPQGIIASNGQSDPVNYYYKPLIGSLYRRRIQVGLDLLTGPYEQVLEFGCGGGLLLPTLAKLAKSVYAIDTNTDPDVATQALAKINVQATILRGDITLANLPKSEFDLIIAFSVFEHIADPSKILQCMSDMLRPGGELLVGMPRVSPWMEMMFPLIGFQNISDHHVKNHQDFIKDSTPWFSLQRIVHMPRYLPSSMGLYFNMIFQKKKN